MTPLQRGIGYVVAPVIALTVVFPPLSEATDYADKYIGTKLELKDNSLGAHVRAAVTSAVNGTSSTPKPPAP